MSEGRSVRGVKLPFQVVYSSSFDEMYPPSELETHNSRTRGWQSRRMPEYPQVLVLDFGHQVDISKVQILSHQSKIATTIDLYIGTILDRTMSIDNAAHFTDMRRLGYLSLDDNARTNFQARELKSVYLQGAVGRYLKLVMQGCHESSVNVFMQVGIVAINVIGEVVAGVSITPSSVPPLGTGHSMPGAGLGSKATSVEAMIMELIARKEAAVEREDYDEAKAMKIAIERLRAAETRILDLEREKAACVAQEDFDGAKRCKVQVEILRREALSGGYSAGGDGIGAGQAQGPYSMRDYNNGGMGHGGISGGMGGGGSYPQASIPFGGDDGGVVGRGRRRSGGLNNDIGYPPQDNYNMSGLGGDGNISGSGSGRMHNPPSRYPSDPESSRRDDTFGDPVNRSYIDNRPIKPASNPLGGLGGSGNDSMAGAYPEQSSSSSSSSSTGSNSVSDVDKSLISDRPIRPRDDNRPIGGSGGMGGIGEDGDTSFTTPRAFGSQAGAPSAQEGKAEELSPADLKDAEPLMEVFDPYLIKCVYSKQWGLRQQAMKTLLDILNQRTLPDHDPSKVLEMLSRILRRTIDDSPVVSVDAIHVLEAAVPVFAELRVPPDVLSRNVEPLITPLLKQLANSNARVRSAAHEMLVKLTKHRSVDAKLVVYFLLRPLPKKEADKPLVLKGRAQVLLDIIPHLGFVEGSRGAKAIELSTLCRFIIPALPHRDGSVREAMVALAVKAIEFCGEKQVKAQLKDVPPQIMDSIMTAAGLSADSQAGGSAGGSSASGGNTGSASSGGSGSSGGGAPPRGRVPREKPPGGAGPAASGAGPSGPSSSSSSKEKGSDVSSPRGGTRGKGTASSGSSTKKGATEAKSQHSSSSSSSSSSSTSTANAKHQSTGKSTSSSTAPSADVSAPAPPPPPASSSSSSSSLGHHDMSVDGDNIAEQIGEYDDADIPQGLCQFCEYLNANWTEADLDEHYCQDCPVLTMCVRCEQIIEVKMLAYHVFQECERKDTPEGVEAAQILKKQIDTATKTLKTPQVCPLCFEGVGEGEAGWRQHLIVAPYCNANPRKPLPAPSS